MTTNKRTSKSKKKIVKRNGELVKRLASKYGVSRQFVYMSLSGSKISDTSETIKQEYNKTLSKLNKILDSVSIIKA